MVTNGIPSPRYTPLETLLFFQALRDQDLTDIDFDGISGTLVTLPLVKNDAAFDAARLGADSLQKLYLKLLKDEAREEQVAAIQQNGDASPGTRKRKAASPALPTVEAAAKHAHLLPGLIYRLYSRYRDAEIEAIKQEEEIIDQLDIEIGEIEAGKWDDQLQQNGDLIGDKVPESNDGADGSIATVTVPEVDTTKVNSCDTDASTETKGSAATGGKEAAQAQALQTSTPVHGSPGKQASPYIPIPQQASQSASQSPVTSRLASPQRNVPLAPAIKGQPIAPNGYQYPPGQYGSPGQRPIQMAGQPAGRGYPIAPHPQYQGYPQYPQFAQQPYAQQQPNQQGQQQFQLRPSQQGGFQLPPFQVSAQDPSKAHHMSAQTQSRTSTPQGTPKPAQGSFSNVAPAPYTPQPSPHVAIANDRLTESVVASLRKRRSGTTWKASPAPSAPRSPKQPAAEPISPVRAPAQLKQERQKTPAARDAERARRETTDTKRTTRGTRGSSVASSTQTMSLRGRTRSRSIMSPAPADAPPSRRGVKVEPSTPAEDVETPQPRNTRTRRSTLPPASAAPVRRSPRSTPAPERPDMVHATRNFPRLSAVIMNEISAHRHAGPFQKPVSDRDVEGYHDIIRRPQDIKSIKASISAGAKAVAAALAAADDEALLLPKTEDLVPPRGIINPAQLEKEVMRMFANAVLFNPGDEGLVRDAREMADDVAGKIQDWRGVEREGGEEEEGAGSSKRRKL